MNSEKNHSSNHTIDETYRILTRISINELRDIIDNMDYHEFDIIQYSAIEREKFMNEYGWTFNEYKRAMVNHNDN